MKKRILIIDGNENVVKFFLLLFSALRFTVINSGRLIERADIIKKIKHLKPGIIFLDHDLGAKDTGLDIAEIIPKKNILVLSTSILVSSTRELTDSYRKVGINHFPGKDFDEIMKCIDGNCGCYLPAISQPVS